MYGLGVEMRPKINPKENLSFLPDHDALRATSAERLTCPSEAELAKCAQLKSADLSGCDKITDACVAELVRLC